MDLTLFSCVYDGMRWRVQDSEGGVVTQDVMKSVVISYSEYDFNNTTWASYYSRSQRAAPAPSGDFDVTLQVEYVQNADGTNSVLVVPMCGTYAVGLRAYGGSKDGLCFVPFDQEGWLFCPVTAKARDPRLVPIGDCYGSASGCAPGPNCAGNCSVVAGSCTCMGDSCSVRVQLIRAIKAGAPASELMTFVNKLAAIEGQDGAKARTSRDCGCC